MKKIKKISLFFLTVSLLFATLVLFSCGKDDKGNEGNGTGDKDSCVYIVSSDTFRDIAELNSNGKIKYISEESLAVKDEKYITEEKTYYAVVKISGEKFSRARFSLEGDFQIINSALTLGESSFFKITSLNGASKFEVKKLEEDVKQDFYAAVQFTVSRDYAGVPITVTFDYSTDAEGKDFENSCKKEKEIRLIHKADVVSSAGYLNGPDYQSGRYDDKIQSDFPVTLAVGEKAYLVFDFKLSNETEISETATASVTMYINPSSGFDYDVAVEALPTTVYEKEDNTIKATFKVHDGINDGKAFRFILSVEGYEKGHIIITSQITGSGMFFVGGYKTSCSVAISDDIEPKSYLDYTLSSDGSYYTVTGLGKENRDTVSIPASYQGVPVKKIDSFVFMEAKHIKRIILNEGLEEIGASAFKNCSNLESVEIPKSVTVIGNEAFAGCDKAEICCVSAEKPSTWSDSWADSDAFITWDSDAFYVLNSDKKSYSFTAAGRNLSSVKILSKYRNLPVTVIADSAFEGNESLESVIMPNGIKLIGKNAFYGCTSLTEIKIPASVTKIEASAFYGCTSLKTVTFAENSELKEICEKAFMACTALTEISLPDSLETIGDSVFEECTELKTVNFDEDSVLKTLGKRVFYNAQGLLSIAINTEFSYVPEYAFYGCASLETVTFTNGGDIGKYAFYGCTSLTETNFSKNLEKICEYAFSGCTSLTSFSVPYAFSVMESGAFSNCTSLKTFVFDINCKLLKIPYRAFENCTSLTSVKLGNFLIMIDEFAFTKCTQLSEITIPDRVETVGSSAFYLCTGLTTVKLGNKVGAIGNSTFSGCSSLKSITFNDALLSVGEYAFMDCDALIEVTMPKSVKVLSYGMFLGCDNLKTITISWYTFEIGKEAFSGCTSLENIIFSGYNRNLTKIDEKAFYNCTSLTSVTIPDGVERIEDSAFEGCEKLTEVTLGAKIEMIRYHAFYNCKALTEINYKGSEQQWTAVTKGNDWDCYDNNGVDEKLDYTLNFNYVE